MATIKKSKKYQAGGVAHASPKAPMVDPDGAWTKVQERNLPKAKDGNWISKAINPKHKGFCSPQTKATCTPKRKALAKTLRKISKNRKK